MNISDPFGENSLSTFLDQAQQNISLQRATLPSPVYLGESAFQHVFVHLNDMRGTQPVRMFQASYDAWKQAIVTIASGGPAYSYVILQKSLDVGLQGFLLARDGRMAKKRRERVIRRTSAQALRGGRKQRTDATRAYSILVEENFEAAARVKRIESRLIRSDGLHPNMEPDNDVGFAAAGEGELYRVGSQSLNAEQQRLAWSLAALTADSVLRLMSLVFPEFAARASLEDRLFTLALDTFDMSGETTGSEDNRIDE